MQNETLSYQPYSYRSHLWDATDQIFQYESETYSYLKNFLFVLSQLQCSETETATSSAVMLSHINPSFCFKNKETSLYKCLEGVYTQLQHINKIHFELSKQLKNNLITPLSEIVNHNCELRNEYENDLSEMKHLKMKLDNEIEIKQEEYHKKVNYDFEKQIQLGDKANINKDTLTQAKNAEKEYIDTINKSNDNIDKSFSHKTKILDNLQLLDKNILETLKRFYMELFAFQNKTFQHLIDNNNKANDYIKQINPQDIIQNFIQQKRTTKTMLSHYDFHIFHPKHFNKEDYPNYSYFKEYLVRNYPYTDPKFSHNEYSNEYKQIYKYTQLFLEQATEDEFAKHSQCIELITRNKDFQYYFLKCLNKNRSTLQNMKQASYETVRLIMNTILDKAVVEYNNKTEFGQDDKLILILRTIIILSQTFYNIEHPNGRKILQDDIKIHPIWKIFNIWKDIIDYHVNDTETSQNNTTNNKDKEKIKKDNIISALISFKMNMEFFGVPVSIITELMKSNCVLYGLNEQYLFF
jgi:hypothetical protein